MQNKHDLFLVFDVSALGKGGSSRLVQKFFEKSKLKAPLTLSSIISLILSSITRLCRLSHRFNMVSVCVGVDGAVQ